MQVLYIVLAAVGGLLIGWLWMGSRVASLKGKLREETVALEKQAAILQEKLAAMQASNEELARELSTERQNVSDLSIRFARLEADDNNLRQKLSEQKQEVEDLQKKFRTEFENIANKILQENSKEFTFLNQKNISDILSPLKEKIEKFEKKVEDTYEKGIKDQTDMRAELKKLYDLNARISEEANNLTRALKSDSKKMGNWGELILDRILEQSGLTKGEEYFTQFTDKSEDGTILRPDVVIMLPENKHIIVDSKVSLVAYDQYVNTNDDNEKEKFLRMHYESVREHVKGLSEKNYSRALKLDTPNFVLLFMPLESAFSLAMQYDHELFNYAWQRRIVIVSPTTLLATLMTVESIWKHEKQTQNALEIARQGNSLYDKFVNFIKDLERIGTQISSLQDTYQDAHKKLTSGKGNLVRQAEKLKELGVKTEKTLSEKFLPENEDAEPEEI
jgi:DNA recombination protein RmuC